MTYAVAALVVIALVAFIATRKKSSKGIDGTGNGGWHILGPTVNGKIVQQQVTLEQDGNGWSVEFGPNSFLHAVVRKGAGLPAMPVVLEVEGDFTKLNGSPAFVHLYVQRKGDTWTSKGKYNHYRYYSPLVPLKAGRIVLDYPLTGWTNIGGPYGVPSSEAEFQATLRNIDNWGVRFGPHGVKGVGRIEYKGSD